MNNLPGVISKVVKNDLCIGCGLCVYKCPSSALKMSWSEYGFLIPELAGKCDLNGNCLSVCPFNPSPTDDVKTEDELAQLYFHNTLQQHKKIGKYNNIYAGYSNEYRLTSSSGGVATYIFSELLKRKIVNYVLTVKESSVPGAHYEYTVSSTEEELLTSSKTKYFPVTLSSVFCRINELEGKVAIVGIACFIKAIRLTQYSEQSLKEKIPFLVGIICGGVKSRFFTEYLADKADVALENIQKPQFRIKDLNAEALDYSFGCFDKSTRNEKTIKMRSVGDMWGTGYFKANACDFCDDVASELADISLGDAWIPPYNKDGRGTNVIVTRSFLADKLIDDGIKSGQLYIEQLEPERFIASQQGGFNHRHVGLSVRLKVAKTRNVTIPPKRFNDEKVSIPYRVTQHLRMIIRKKSLDTWRKFPDAAKFDIKMRPYLIGLKIITRIYHYKMALQKRLKI